MIDCDPAMKGPSGQCVMLTGQGEPGVACHKNTSLKTFVVVIPKEGLAGGAPPILLLV